MPLLGQASGGWTESSSALRLLHVGVRNTVGILTDDAFTQTNPPIVTTPTTTISDKVDTSVLGVLSGSVAFTRPDQGSNYIGGNRETLPNALHETFVRPLGLFINNAAGYAYENQPAAASGKGPYVSAMGTYANQLYETQALGTNGAGVAQGDTLNWLVGQELVASRNGYLMPRRAVNTAGGAVESLDVAAITAEVEHGLSASTLIGILKMPADSVQNEIVFDQRV
jgi:hypothetical protein